MFLYCGVHLLSSLSVELMSMYHDIVRRISPAVAYVSRLRNSKTVNLRHLRVTTTYDIHDRQSMVDEVEISFLHRSCRSTVFRVTDEIIHEAPDRRDLNPTEG
jgi:hypothetical protein